MIRPTFLLKLNKALALYKKLKMFNNSGKVHTTQYEVHFTIKTFKVGS